MSKPTRSPRVVRLAELNRILTALAERGIVPAAYDLLPGGVVRLHANSPANDDGASAAEERGWDAALGE